VKWVWFVYSLIDIGYRGDSTASGYSKGTT